MALANQEAQGFNHEYVGTEHILLGLTRETDGVGTNVLKNLDVDLRKVRMQVQKLAGCQPDNHNVGKLPLTPRAKKAIEYATEEARSLNHNYVGTEHLLLGLLREQDGVAAQVIMNLGHKLEDVREEVLKALGVEIDAEEEKETPALPEAETVSAETQESFQKETAAAFLLLAEQYEAIARTFREAAARLKSR
jgi:ATP-dependent Clp protease ATP-binding subunit ClpC